MAAEYLRAQQDVDEIDHCPSRVPRLCRPQPKKFKTTADAGVKIARTLESFRVNLPFQIQLSPLRRDSHSISISEIGAQPPMLYGNVCFLQQLLPERHFVFPAAFGDMPRT